MPFVRKSKFKHVFGKPCRRDQCYEGIKISNSAIDSTFCAVNPKFLAVILESSGGGQFIVIPLHMTGRLDKKHPNVLGHTGAVCDLKWCPHNDNVIASGSEDCTIRVWDIPDAVPEDSSEYKCLLDLAKHQRRVSLIEWHPSAEHVLASAGADSLVIVWNLSTGTAMTEINLDSSINSLNFNHNGSLIVVCSKDGMTHIVDAHDGSIKNAGVCHEGKKPQQAIFLCDGRVFTTGFSKRSERQYALWDADNLEKAVFSEGVDNSSGILYPYYDFDLNLIYLVGRGDSTVRYFEYVPAENSIYYLNRFDSSDLQRGFAFMGKRGVSVNSCEITRLYKLHNKSLCEVISFTVPRKSDQFQEDIYPDTASYEPALTADQWFSGENADPKTMSMEKMFTSKGSQITRSATSLSAMPRSALLSEELPDSTASEVASLRKDVDRLSDMVEKLSTRLTQLETGTVAS